MDTEDDRCKGCFYNRPMRAWGETFDACFYRLEVKAELYTTSDGGCSGFEEAEKQLEIAI